MCLIVFPDAIIHIIQIIVSQETYLDGSQVPLTIRGIYPFRRLGETINRQYLTWCYGECVF